MKKEANKKEEDKLAVLKKEADDLSSKRAEMAMQRLTELADGIWYEKVTLANNIKIFKKEPNADAAKYLVDRAKGKPAVSIQGPGDDGAFVFKVMKYDA